MNKELKTKGGAIVGFLQAKTPLVSLSVNQNVLYLKSSILGEYKFTDSEIVSLNKVRILFSTGIKIIHNKTNFPNRIIFFCSEINTDTLLENINRIGFSPAGEAGEKNSSMSWNLPNVLMIALAVFLIFWFVVFYFF